MIKSTNHSASDTSVSLYSEDYKYLPSNETDNSEIMTKSWVARTFSSMEKGSQRSSIIALMSCAMGSALLALPSNARNSGLIIELLLLAMCAAVSRLSMFLILQSSYKTDITSFPGLVEHCLGKPFKRAFEFNIIFYMYGSVVCLQIIFASFLWEACQDIFGLAEGSKEIFILIFNLSFIVLNLPISMMKDVYSLRYFIQLQLAVIAYIVIAMIAYFMASFDSKILQEEIKFVIIDKNVFGSFASTFYGFIVHQLILPLRLELQDGSYRRMSKVCSRSTVSTLTVYAFIMVVGYITWFGATETLIIDNYPNMYFTVAKGLMAFALFFAVPLNLNPMRLAVLESLNKKDSRKAFILTTVIIQVSSGMLAYVYPNVKSGFGFLGGFLGLNMVVVVPCMLYVKTFGWSAKTNVIVFICTVATLMGWTGAVLSQIYKE